MGKPSVQVPRLFYDGFLSGFVNLMDVKVLITVKGPSLLGFILVSSSFSL